ncbi:hypothetical protein ACFE04_013365 [Oxalis oulophora]
MRLTKGSKVEVLVHKDDSIASSSPVWRCAEVISGNGRMYVVKYLQFRTSFNNALEEEVEDKVSRKAIRPLPPPVLAIHTWIPGDVLEVFHLDSWKTAMLLKNIDDNYFSVSLLGGSHVFQVHRSYLRVPQTWENGEWSVVSSSAIISSVVDDHNCYVVSPRTLKRGSPLGFSCVEDYDAPPTKKLRKDGAHRQTYYPHPGFEKVDTFVSPLKISGENVVLFPSNSKSNGFSDAHTGSTNDNSFAEPDLSIDALSCASSVGSCSAGENYFPNLYNSVDDYSSDADSSSSPEYKNEGYFVPRLSKAEYHLSEVCKYRRVVEQLYATGSLSWEQEAQLMDLRCSLNISDDEHLVILKSLMSADNRIR